MKRMEALALGLKTYTGGKKCARHPDSPRRAVNGNCHKCICDRVRSAARRRKRSSSTKTTAARTGLKGAKRK